MANGYQRNVLYFGNWFRILSGSGVCEQGISVVTVLLDVTAGGGRHLHMFPDEATTSFFRVEEYN